MLFRSPGDGRRAQTLFRVQHRGVVDLLAQVRGGVDQKPALAVAADRDRGLARRARLRVAGTLTEFFDPRARREVYRLSGGVPRVMNVICDRALLGAYSRESRTVNKRLVRRAANEVSGQSLPPVYVKFVVPVISVVGLIVLGAALWAMFDRQSPVTAVPASVPVAAEPLELATATIAEQLEQPGNQQPGLEMQLATLDTASVSDSGLAAKL